MDRHKMHRYRGSEGFSREAEREMQAAANFQVNFQKKQVGFPHNLPTVEFRTTKIQAFLSKPISIIIIILISFYTFSSLHRLH